MEGKHLKVVEQDSHRPADVDAPYLLIGGDGFDS